MSRRTLRAVSGLLGATIFLQSCATIIQPGPDRIPVRSEPEGARVYLNGTPVGVTPTVVVVKRAEACEISVQKDGYQDVLVDRGKVVAGWVFANILLGGVIGLTVDLITHHQGKYPEEPVLVTLQSKSVYK